MRVTGPAAQFGRGVMQDVSAKLMTRFADCLAEQMQASPDVETTTEEAAARPPRPERRRGRDARPPRPPATSDAGATETVEDTGVPEAPPRGVSQRRRREPTIPSASSRHARRPRTGAPTDDVLDLGEASRDAVLKRARSARPRAAIGAADPDSALDPAR